MASIVRGTLHATALAAMLWGYLELENTAADEWIRTQKGGHWQFLTIQGLGLACVTTFFSLCADLLPSITLFKTLKRTVFMIAMPLSVVISSIYWSLLLFAPTLILPPNPEQTTPTSSPDVPNIMRLPLHHDLALHAVPAISMMLDFILFESRYGPSATQFAAPVMSLLYCGFYSTFVEHVAEINGTFPYPFLTENPFPIRVGIYFGATSIALVSFWILNSLKPRRT